MDNPTESFDGKSGGAARARRAVTPSPFEPLWGEWLPKAWAQDEALALPADVAQRHRRRIAERFGERAWTALEMLDGGRGLLASEPVEDALALSGEEEIAAIAPAFRDAGRMLIATAITWTGTKKLADALAAHGGVERADVKDIALIPLTTNAIKGLGVTAGSKALVVATEVDIAPAAFFAELLRLFAEQNASIQFFLPRGGRPASTPIEKFAHSKTVLGRCLHQQQDLLAAVDAGRPAGGEADERGREPRPQGRRL